MNIAIIGSGISGLASAYFLSDKHQVKLFEKNNYFGGHSNSVLVNYDGKEIAVDCGFIVFNHQTYPNLKAFFKLLGVAYENSNMSFGVKINGGKFEYAGTNLKTVFAQFKNAFNPQFYLMLRDILRFNKKAEEILQKPFDENYSLKTLLDDLSLKKYFREFYLLPMSGAIWSCPLETMLAYPAQSFVRFFKNHGLLTVADQPRWFTVTGTSKKYVEKIINKIGEQAVINEEVLQVIRQENGKILVKSKNHEELFDKVVFATHGDDVLRILQNPSTKEVEIFSKFKYQKNSAILHKDSSVMPKTKKAWASWVYSKNAGDAGSDLSVSYWMNNLQNIDQNYPLFVTLNANQKIPEDKIFAKIEYKHPIFDADAIAAQSRIDEVQGVDNIYFCGAYQKYGFHEDGISSALNAINKMGVKAPWQ